MVSSDINTEVSDTVKEELKKRLLSPIFGTFIIYSVISHWQFFVTAFLVSSDQIWVAKHMLKAEYLKVTYANPHDWYFYASWIVPAVFTWLTIWKFPDWFLLKADQKDTDYRVAKENIRLQGEKKIIREELAVQRISTKKAEQETQKIKKQREAKSILSQDQIWKEEFDEFRKSHLFSKMRQLESVLYTNSGNTRKWNGTSHARIIDSDILASAHTDGLITINGASEKEKIELTEKGKYFMSAYLKEV